MARALQMLQDTSAATYDATEMGYWIESELKYLADYEPLITEAMFLVESRDGKDVTGTASKLTDSVKSQFLTADGTNEKVVHNITDDTWAVITARDSSSILSISNDIMDADEFYEIYNKRCWNKKQIYLGDMAPYVGIDSVEYPLGTGRHWTLYGDVLELDVEDTAIQDSDSTLTNLSKVNVLVRFYVPPLLCQLTDLPGAVHTTAAAAATTMQIKSFTDDEIIEAGDQFNIADHRTTYIVTTGVTLATQASTGVALSFYPGLESATSADAVITFKKSTLTPRLERILYQRAAAQGILNDNILKLDGINKGGTDVWAKLERKANGILEKTQMDLERNVIAKPYKTLQRL